MKWTKFKDGIPKGNKNIYLTNYTSTWIGYLSISELTWENYPRDNPEYAWAEIPIPETPVDEEKQIKCNSKYWIKTPNHQILDISLIESFWIENREKSYVFCQCKSKSTNMIESTFNIAVFETKEKAEEYIEKIYGILNEA